MTSLVLNNWALDIYRYLSFEYFYMVISIPDQRSLHLRVTSVTGVHLEILTWLSTGQGRTPPAHQSTESTSKVCSCLGHMIMCQIDFGKDNIFAYMKINTEYPDLPTHFKILLPLHICEVGALCNHPDEAVPLSTH